MPCFVWAKLVKFGAAYGALAQLGEHLLCKQGVIGSIPIGSTKPQPSGTRNVFHTRRNQNSRDEDTNLRSFGIVTEGFALSLTL